MNIRDKYLYEYALVRFVPDLDRGEFVNIGLLMLCKRQKWLCTKILIDESRILSLYPAADLELLRRQASVFADACNVPFSDYPPEERFRWMAAVKSASIQTSPTHIGFAVTPDHNTDESEPQTPLTQTFDRLFDLLVMAPGL